MLREVIPHLMKYNFNQRGKILIQGVRSSFAENTWAEGLLLIDLLSKHARHLDNPTDDLQKQLFLIRWAFLQLERAEKNEPLEPLRTLPGTLEPKLSSEERAFRESSRLTAETIRSYLEGIL